MNEDSNQIAGKELNEWVDQEVAKLRKGRENQAASPELTQRMGKKLNDMPSASTTAFKPAIEDTLKNMFLTVTKGDKTDLWMLMSLFGQFKSADFIKGFSSLIQTAGEEKPEVIAKRLTDKLATLKGAANTAPLKAGEQVLNKEEDIRDAQKLLGMKGLAVTGKWDSESLKQLKEKTKEIKKALWSEADDLSEDNPVMNEKMIALIQELNKKALSNPVAAIKPDAEPVVNPA